MPIVTLATLFAVLADPSNDLIANSLNQNFPDDHIQIRPGQWFLVGSGTAKDISDKLKVTPGPDVGSAVIVAVSGYYGRASSPVWEWVASKVGKPTNA